MRVRLASLVMAVMVVSVLLMLAFVALGPTGSAPVAGMPVDELVTGSSIPEDVWDDVIVAPDRPQQDLPGVSRLLSEDFENPDFPLVTAKWAVSDRCAIFPGRRDVVAWGRRECDASHGNASLWAAGGGDVGEDLACGSPYPQDIESPVRKDGCNYMDTMLRYVSFDLTSVSYAVRITFDYKADMPAKALKLYAGVRNDDGSITFTEVAEDFETDTGDDWVRGSVHEFTSVAQKPRVVIAWLYVDETPSGTMQGAMIDNIHIDAMYEATAPLIPSPTVPAPPTETPTKTPFVLSSRTPSPTSTFGPSPTFTATPRPISIAMPVTLKRYDIKQEPEPTVTKAPPTNTVPPTNTRPPTNTVPAPTETERPTRTPKASPTPAPPTNTAIPSPTPIPKPDVQVIDILPLPESPSQQLEIATVKNIGTAPQSMDGWRLFNLSHDENCRFTAAMGVVLEPGDEYEVRSGAHAITDETGFACSDRYIWDNREDEGQLYNNRNRMVSCRAYDEGGQFNCMPDSP